MRNFKIKVKNNHINATVHVTAWTKKQAYIKALETVDDKAHQFRNHPKACWLKQGDNKFQFGLLDKESVWPFFHNRSEIYELQVA